MNRRDFVKNTTTLSLCFGLGFTTIKQFYKDGTAIADLAEISKELQAGFAELLVWMKTHGWSDFLRQETGLNLQLTGNDLKNELLKEIDAARLSRLREKHTAGYDDFSGERLIQPGFPAHSLLFHTIASPRVRPATVNAYPSLQQIDLLENYIYALCNWQQLKSLYNVSSDEDLVFAVFAYEYRPAFKTPHHNYADLVYSRTGIARVGEKGLNYDAVNRCFSNKPKDPNFVKKVAVIPARYGLYLAKKVKSKDISLVTTGMHKGDDKMDDRLDEQKVFLQPIRKIFNNDLLVGSGKLNFKENHKSEKLEKLALKKSLEFTGPKPTARFSADLIVQDDNIRKMASSFLVVSKPSALIRPAKEKGKQLYFTVPPHTEEGFDNRYFTALATQEVEDVELLEGDNPIRRIFNDYKSPRNQPMFVNITNVKNGTGYSPLKQNKTPSFETFMKAGKYIAPLFEDSICDGKVEVDISSLNLVKLPGVSKQCLPAFSIVTAPDFFPQIDPLDLLAYDIAPGLSEESSFYEGGVASLATARIKPNPKMINSKSDQTRDTYLAVLSAPLKNSPTVSATRLLDYKNPALERGYDISGFLPDVASSVFAPGWDVTYCRLDNDEEIYIGTEGLGSPFVEDMKFCSALNGMWPTTSPDASRTFQGGGETDYRNPTAIPLLDHEIGICATGPAGKANECWGWDGEQGPYLEKRSGKWNINFTDLGRADAVNNALQGKLDMSQLRKLKSNEIIARMECLKLCIHTLKKRNFRDTFASNIIGYSYLWLISAEKVNWGRTDAKALGIPEDLIGKNKKWITDKSNAKITGDGYLFVMVNSEKDDKDNMKWATSNKRRWLECEPPIFICQVTNDASATQKIAWAEIDNNGNISWH